MRRFFAMATLALATFPAAAAEDGRYRLEKTPDGYVRMDTRTGEMSLCETRDGQLVCKLAADERAALHDEIDRLTTRAMRSMEETFGRHCRTPDLCATGPRRTAPSGTF